ncbi:MAG: hypothetical protein IT285_07015 [Bdellovibrionales bacterium]|nr:hypothetical protein [Bdellovibrionales bacterium]
MRASRALAAAALAALISVPAFADQARSGCTDFSGTYLGSDAEQAIHQLTLKQKACDSITFIHEVRTGSGPAEVTHQEWRMDGQCRDLPESAGLCLMHRWDGKALMNRGFIRVAGKNAPLPSYIQRLTQGSNGELISEARLFDLTGAELVSAERVVYRRERR